jgi:hypothetical protein
MSDLQEVQLTREQILGANDLPSVKVPVPEWGPGAVVYVKSMTGAERDAFESQVVEGRGPDRTVNVQNIRARLCARCIVNAGGTPLFTDADVEALGAKSAKVLDRIFEQAQKLNGLRKEDVDELGKP